VGYLSDRTKTRWGRRIPYLMFGGIPLAVFFVLMWYPPFKPNTTAMAAWLVATNTCFFLTVTVVFCPYLGLMPEITRTKDERIFVNQLMNIFLFAGTGIVMVLPMFFNPVNDNPMMFVIIAVLGLVSIFIPVIGIKEEKFSLSSGNEEHYGIIQALKWTFSNKAFLFFVAGSIFYWVGFQIVMNGLKYVVNDLLGKDDTFMTKLFVMIVISVILSFVLMNKISKKVSKKTIYIVCSLIMGLTIPLEYFLAYDNFLGLPTLTTAYIIFFFLGVPIAGIMTVQTPMLADIADYDAKLTGHRREAIFFGAQGILNKYSIALSFVISGQLFEIFGYTKENPMGIQLLGPVTGAFILIGCIIFIFYPLNEKTLELEPVRLFGRKKK